MSEHTGLYNKYTVDRISDVPADESKHKDCRYFVLDPQHDEAAKHALGEYAYEVRATHPELSRDIYDWLDKLE